MTAVSVPSGTAGRVRLARPADGLLDGGFVVVLGVLGMVGFRTLYGGVGCVLVGFVGLALGVAVAELSRRWRQPVLVEAAVAVVLFLVLGGAVAVRGGGEGALPTPSVVRALGHVGIYGWKELLTTAPPVGDTFNLLAIPYIVGLVGGVAGHSLARRTRSPVLPLAGPVVVLALGVLFGARHPTSLLLQGSLFGGLSLAWVTVRHHRYRPVIVGGRLTPTRAAGGATLLVVAVLAAGVLAPALPGAGRPRVVLSKYITPPFEANNQSSPLAGFRQYAKDGRDYDTPLFTVKGLPAGSAVRLATMDAYDGIEWGFGAGSSGNGPSAADSFQRYGSVFPTDAPGREVTVQITIGRLGGTWLPDVGETDKVTFSGTRAAALTDDLRYDSQTYTTAEMGGLSPGDTYRVRAVIPAEPTAKALAGAAAGAETAAVDSRTLPSILVSDANEWSSGATSAWGKVSALASALLTKGYYSDGNENPPLSAPGHGSGRLTTFLEGGGLVGTDIVGDDEQYAATLALMANAVGVPARVVLGAPSLPADGTVEGKDIRAWVEVDLAGLGWVQVPSSSFIPDRQAHETPPTEVPQASAAPPVQPPVQTAIRSPLDDELPGQSSSATSHFATHRASHGWRVPGWVTTSAEGVVPVLAVVALAVGGVAAVKRRRRGRRRRSGSTSDQIAGAWAELVDAARDAGLAVASSRTRREQAEDLQVDGAAAFAGRTDSAVFAPGDPTGEEVTECWSSFEAIRAQIFGDLGRWARWRAILSLRSLRLADRS